MKKSLVLGAALALLSGGAMAADLPAKAPVYKAPVAASVYNWTGFYIGGNAGYGWGRVKPGTVSFYDPIDTLAGTLAGLNSDTSGFIGGGQAGYNFQSGNFVFGLEADFSWSGIKGSVTDTVNGYSATSRLDWLATGRARAGVAFDRVLFYGTGGIAAGRAKTTIDDYYGVTITTEDAKTHVGWTAGAGIEAALSPNWTVRAEYLYVDLGSKEYNFYEPAGFWPRISTSTAITESIVRGAINYKF